MKQGKRVLALVLTLVLIIGALPMAAFAESENGKPVLESLTYENKTFKVGSNNTIHIEVPYSSKTVEVDTTKITVNRAAIDGLFNGDSLFEPEKVTLDKDGKGESRLTCIYDEGPGSKEYETEYTVEFEMLPKKASVFEGDISIDLNVSEVYTFDSSEIADYYKINNGTDLSYVMAEGGDDSVAVLSPTGKILSSKLGTLKVAAKKEGKTYFTLTAYDKNSQAVSGNVKIYVNVKKVQKLDTVSATINQTDTYYLKDLKIADKFKKASGTELSSITFTELPRYGTIKSGSTTLSTKKNTFTASQLTSAKYTPGNSTKTVTDVMEYVAQDKSGNEYSGKIEITVDKLGINDISITVKSGTPYSFGNLKLSTQFKTDTKKELSYAYFDQPENGELRYKYTSKTKKGDLVNYRDEYYVSGSKNDLISDLTYISDSSFEGTDYIYYEACDKNDNSFKGRIKVTVSDSDLGEIGTYDIDSDEVFSFKDNGVATDINTAFKAIAKSNFDYVKFVLPDSDEGVLRYGYTSESKPGTKLSAATKVYRSSTSGTTMNDLVFIPDADFSGTCEIEFTAYTDDDEYDGILVFKVDTSDYDIATIKYTIDKNSTFTFKSVDINTKFKKVADESFDYLIFSELPSTKKGTLYYDYDTKKAKGTVVEEDDDEFYRSEKGKILISDLVFVPAKDATGKVDFVYWAYSDDQSFDGKITITIEDVQKDIGGLTYKIYNNQIMRLNSADFVSQFKKLTSENLDYIQLELPAAKAGKFCYDYTSASKNGGVLFADDELHRSGTKNLLIDSVYFVPEIDYIGTLDIKYTAYDEDGVKYNGKMTVSVMEPSTFKDVKTGDWFLNSVKWGTGRGIVNGISATEFAPAQTCTWAHILTFLWRANGQPEPAKKTLGDINVADSNQWYAKAILWAVEKKIAPDTATKNAPGVGLQTPCTRAQALQFIYKASGSPAVSGLTNKFADVKSSDEAYNAVLWGVDKGITNGTGKDKSGNMLFEPNTICTRGHIITFLYRAIELKDLQK